MRLPSPRAGDTTTTAGFFQLAPRALAEWIAGGVSAAVSVTAPRWRGLDDAVAALAPVVKPRRLVCTPLPGGAWTVFLNNTLLGTDVGLYPRRAASRLGIRAVRAVCTAEDDTFPARILEVYGPDGTGPERLERSLAAANDGGRWVFESFGPPYPFEDVEAYRRRRKSDRFTAEMLERYLLALGIPVNDEPLWPEALLLEYTWD